MIRRLLVVGLLGVMSAQIAAAQNTQRCYFDNTGETRQLTVKLPSGQYNTFFGAGIFVRCPAKSLTLRSDSLESYGDEGRIYLLGNVRYDEPRLALTSDYLTYYQRDERIVANGNVNARLPSGSTLKGPVAEYLRAIPNVRPVPRLLATGRPAITIVQKDSAGQPAPPATVVANSVTMIGDSLVYAGGSVVVNRTDVTARGDSMALDSQRELTVLLRSPSIEGRRDRPFTLSGDRIELTGKNRKLQRVLSTGKAKAVSEDLTLTSDTIDLRVTDDLLQRAVAWGPARARATSATQQLQADSIDVAMPNQRVREMYAVRRALAEGRPDSTRFKADTTDWMRGDTIVARFDTLPVKDSARTTRIRELVAMGHAKSYYHLAPSDTTTGRAAINYVIGREIVVAFQSQRVSQVRVIEQAGGVYLEPRARGAEADSSRVTPPSPTTRGTRTAPVPTQPATRPATITPSPPTTSTPPAPPRPRPPA